jgi:hypothetical protein
VLELAWLDDRIPAPPGPTDGRLVLFDALRRLPFEQREAIDLHYLADLPIADIAARTGAPVGMVKARLFRGRDALATMHWPTRAKGAVVTSDPEFAALRNLLEGSGPAARVRGDPGASPTPAPRSGHGRRGSRVDPGAGGGHGAGALRSCITGS